MSRFAAGDRVTFDAKVNEDPFLLCMQSHVQVAVADGDLYLVVVPGQHQKYGPYKETRFTPGWGMPGDAR